MLISPVIPYTIAKVFITIKIYIAGTIGQLMLYLLVFRLTIYILLLKLDFRPICKLWNERNIFKIFIRTLKTEIESSNLNKIIQRI